MIGPTSSASSLRRTLPDSSASFHRSNHGSQALRRSLLEWIEASNCGWCLTLNPNRSHALGTEVKVIREAFADADRSLLGERYNRVDARKRMMAFIVPEHVSSNLHFHLAVRPGLPADETEERARTNALAAAWQVRVPSGTFAVEPMINSWGWARYMTKELWRGDAEFVSSSMWWPERQRRHVLERSWRDPQTPSLGVK